MFKAIGNLIHKTPWWALILGGISTLTLLVLFTLPVQVIRLVDSGATPAERHAIQREVGLAVGSKALNLAQGVVSTIRDRTTDPERLRELERALTEIERARSELVLAQNGVDESVADSAREAAEAAMEAATDAAEDALEAAIEARQAIEETQQDAIERLRDKGVDVSGAMHSFEQLLASARENEKSARESLAALRALPPETRGIGAPRVYTRPQLELSPDVKDTIRAKVGGDVWRVAVGSALILVFIPLFLMVIIAKFFISRSRNALALAERKTREAELSDVSRQVTEARLQTLQAQVEPHFLYNTLANVQALNEVDPPAANLMVGHLIQYLRSSLPKMRESTSTVGQELELVRAYLNILQMRMGPRLEFSIEAPDDLLPFAFPPMMLPSLVENAIKHGLEPLREGGRIDIVAERTQEGVGQCLRVSVKDTGKGLSDTGPQAGGGLGLSNLRERLAALYGSHGRFTLTANEPKGMVATIEVPLQSAAAFQASQPEALTGVPVAAAVATPAATATVPPKGWGRVWNATSKTHSLWARLLARTFVVLMVVLGGVLLAGFVALLTGWLPVQVGDVQLDGIESIAIGSVGLLIGFGATALAIVIVLTVVYGLGFLFAALVIFIPAAILMGVFPFLAPFILMGLGLWWLLTRRSNRA
ncbi:histidine kinase [Rhodoferax sp. AJA081-3]|uniref:histidine kinase n=1 Tax=Rhodoferax sp. AJA081-3 TaxID=2752316 RepID=UPI001ADF4FC8|nr:histidine kinase [Rhodoferax sp. AJA081-3]QTN26980.1 histidine kinase [Rhodoferax sp. AJA081-3]